MPTDALAWEKVTRRYGGAAFHFNLLRFEPHRTDYQYFIAGRQVEVKDAVGIAGGARLGTPDDDGRARQGVALGIDHLALKSNVNVLVEAPRYRR